MKISIPEAVFEPLHAHLFRAELEEGAFLFGRLTSETFVVDDVYLVPSSGWDVQLEVYLEMRDDERARIMRMAVERGDGVVDCHSHPGAGDDVWFSPSDVIGIRAFAQYAKWKLRGGVYIATVWGESSVDAVSWSGTFKEPDHVEAVDVTGKLPRRFQPTGSWFREPRAYRRKDAWHE